LPAFRFKVTYLYIVMELQVNREHEETLRMKMRKFGTRFSVDMLVEGVQLSDPQWPHWLSHENINKHHCIAIAYFSLWPM